jgi:signal transduction histidine kinase
VKFTPDGGHVEVVARSQTNGELHISVTDSGIGILPDQVGRIFEPFHQGTRMPSHHVPTGTGLGLSLAQSLVELHGGRIWVHSVPDQGSTFTVALPVVVAGVRSLESTTGAGR